MNIVITILTISSTIRQSLSSTSPTTCITWLAPGAGRLLSITAISVSNFFANPLARSVPPASGLTKTNLSPFKFALISATKIGLAKSVSTGISKNPCICPACKSTVNTRSAPAVVIKLAPNDFYSFDIDNLTDIWAEASAADCKLQFIYYT